MPVYCFKCPACGARKDVLRSIDARNDLVACEKCVWVHKTPGEGFAVEGLAAMVRDLQGERLGSTDLPYAQPVLSDAMGINPSQIPEFQRAHPNVEVARDGRIVLRSHHERKRVMKELGFLDRKGF